MKVILCGEYEKNNENIYVQSKEKTAVALGNFDGVHIGHAELIKSITSVPNAYSCVYTFEKHPENIIYGKNKTLSITTNEQKVSILASMGVDYVCFDDFEEIRDYSPRKFIDEVLIGKLNASYVVCGFHFRFGKNCVGDADFLKAYLERRKIPCKVVSPVLLDNFLVSSTRIRFLLENGDVELAGRLLGRNYAIKFPVITGRRFGRTIGIPTINQRLPDETVHPKNGVYICTCLIGDNEYKAVADIGIKPTVGGNELLCETHILDFDGFLYGYEIEVKFHKRLRDETKYASIDELRAAIMGDISATRNYFAARDRNS